MSFKRIEVKETSAVQDLLLRSDSLEAQLDGLTARITALEDAGSTDAISAKNLRRTLEEAANSGPASYDTGDIVEPGCATLPEVRLRPARVQFYDGDLESFARLLESIRAIGDKHKCNAVADREDRLSSCICVCNRECGRGPFGCGDVVDVEKLGRGIQAEVDRDSAVVQNSAHNSSPLVGQDPAVTGGLSSEPGAAGTAPADAPTVGENTDAVRVSTPGPGRVGGSAHVLGRFDDGEVE